MSQTIIALAVSLIGFILNTLGVTVGTEEVTVVVVTAMQLGGILYAWYRRATDPNNPVSVLGVRK